MSKIIIAGDSIAYGKWDLEGGWVARLRKYIDEKYNLGKINNFQVFNLGIPGEVTPRLAKRFDQELKMRLPLEDADKRNLVILAVGINDSCPNNWMTLKQTSQEEFKDSFGKLINIALQHECKVVVIGLTPVNIAKSKGLLFSDEEVQKYDKYISEVCEEKHVPKLDLFDYLQKINFPNLLLDVVHPNEAGHKILSDKVIEFLTSKGLFQYLTS